MLVVDIDADPMPHDNLVVSARELYDLAVHAHRKAAEVLAFHAQQFQAWVEAGKPTKHSLGPRNNEVPDGFFVLTPMQLSDINRYLEQQTVYINYLGMAYNQYVQIPLKEFKQYTKVRFSLKE